MPYYMARDVRATLGTSATQCQNRSLLAFKFPDLAIDDSDKDARKRTIARMIGTPTEQEGYRARNFFFETIRSASSFDCDTFIARLCGSLIVNQAGGVVENAGLCLDRHFGMPYIPGSALKGVARAAARQIASQQSEIPAVFGWSSGAEGLADELKDKSHSGAVAFLPAYPVKEAPLVMDILTCHHPNYYQGSAGDRALDNESPIPNQFPVVEAGADFGFAIATIASESRLDAVKKALGLPMDFNPLEKARSWLVYGLTELGIGAKTSAGYGWFHYDEQKERERLKNERDRRRAEEEKRQRQAAMTPLDRAKEKLLRMGDQDFAGFARTLADRSPEEQRAFFQILRVEKRDRWKIWKKKKQDMAQTIRGIASKLEEELR